MIVTLDTGALIAFEGRDERLLALLDRLRQRDGRVAIPAGVAAQAWRSPTQARLTRLLRARDVTVVTLDDRSARIVGLLLGRAATTDTVDAHVVVVARETGGPVITSDPRDLRRLDGTLVIHLV